MEKEIDIYEKIGSLVSAYINAMQEGQRWYAYLALMDLLGERYARYPFGEQGKKKTYEQLQNELFKINEKSANRRAKGVYYTPEDVCTYIVWNTMVTMLSPDNGKTYARENALEKLLTLPIAERGRLLFDKNFFDPACGLKCTPKVRQTFGGASFPSRFLPEKNLGSLGNKRRLRGKSSFALLHLP